MDIENFSWHCYNVNIAFNLFKLTYESSVPGQGSILPSDDLELFGGQVCGKVSLHSPTWTTVCKSL